MEENFSMEWKKITSLFTAGGKRKFYSQSNPFNLQFQENRFIFTKQTTNVVFEKDDVKNWSGSYRHFITSSTQIQFQKKFGGSRPKYFILRFHDIQFFWIAVFVYIT